MILQPAVFLLFIRHFIFKTRTKQSLLHRPRHVHDQQDTRRFVSVQTCPSVFLIYQCHVLSASPSSSFPRARTTTIESTSISLYSRPKLALTTTSKPSSQNPLAKLVIMAPSANAIPKVHSPSSFLELLPATTYIIPKPRVMTPQSHLTDHEFDMPVKNETKAATTKRRPGSVSTVSRVVSSDGGDRKRFLELAPVPALEK